MSFRINSSMSHPVIQAMDNLLSPKEQVQARESAMAIVELVVETTDVDKVIKGDPMCEDISAVTKEKSITDGKDVYRFLCPHCLVAVEVEINQVNCKIFRHGAYKSTLQPIPPHTSKDQCDQLVKSGDIYGCAGPLRFLGDAGNYKVEKCDYI
jgi:hypothetical protein